jgi:hypothetical protein
MEPKADEFLIGVSLFGYDLNRLYLWIAGILWSNVLGLQDYVINHAIFWTVFGHHDDLINAIK